jgi:lysophospholipase L1-like esterase
MRSQRKLSVTLAVATGVAIGIAAVSIGFNVWLAAALHHAFRDLQFARIFPLGAPPAAHGTARTADAIRPTLAFYGDSRALLWDTKPLVQRFRVVNLAVGAQTSAQLRLQLEAEPRVVSDWAVVEVGINDLHPLGVLGELRETIVTELDRNLGAIVERLLERSTCVVIVTIVPPGSVPWERRWVWDRGTLDAVAAANLGIAKLAHSEHNSERIRLLDAARLLAAGRQVLPPQYVSRDSFLHVNGDAYNVLNRALGGILVNTVGVAAGTGEHTVETAAGDAGPGVASSCRYGAQS